MAYFREHTHPRDWLRWMDFAKDHRYDRHTAIGPGIWLNSIEKTIKQFRDTRAPSPSGNFGQGVVGYYRARGTVAWALTDFASRGEGEPALFRNPSFSGSTGGHIATVGGLPNLTAVTAYGPSGSNSGKTLRAAWNFQEDTPDPWLRLTTYHAPVWPNPTVAFTQGIRFFIHTDRPVWVTIGLRETNSSAEIGVDGGVSGPIEWVGGVADNESRPPRGQFIPAGEWVPVEVFLPFAPVRDFTGNGVLESDTG